MARNSVAGSFQDIEISFSVDIDCIRMNLRNLVSDEKQMRVMYQKQPSSGLANWQQFQLAKHPVSLRLPNEVLEAYRLTFFVDDAEPISARVEKVLAELDTPRNELPEADLSENVEAVTDPESVETSNQVKTHTPEESEVVVAQQVEATPDLPGIQPLTSTFSEANIDAYEEPAVIAAEQVEVTPNLSKTQPPKQTPLVRPENRQEFDEQPDAPYTVGNPSTIRKVKAELPSVTSRSEFKISIRSLPPSALAKQRKAQMNAAHGSTDANTGRKSKNKENGFLGQLVRTLKGGKRGKAYYQEQGETIQNEFQDQLSKLERDYNEGYGLDLTSWKPESLCEEETAIFLLNLMVNEIIAWRKERGRATPETGGIVETLAEVDRILRQTLKQTRGISTPSPTLFPNLLAENERDLEKIRNECDAYLRRFTSKLIEQEKKHATKIEVLSFRKFLTEFVRDYLFAEIAKNTQGYALPKRLNWFLELVNSEIMSIEIGETKVLSTHHKVKDARPSEYETGTIVEVIKPGLQSTDGKRVNQMAVVIEAE